MAVVPATGVASGSGVNGKIAFSSGNHGYVVDADGAGLQPAPDRLYWGPDGRKAAYALAGGGYGDPHRACIWSFDDYHPAHCIGEMSRALQLAWSPDGRRLTNGEQVFDVATGVVSDVPGECEDCREPQWSPDGTVFMVETYDHAAAQWVVAIVDPEEGEQRRIAPGPAEVVAASSWTPDGMVSFTAVPRSIPAGDQSVGSLVVVSRDDGARRTYGLTGLPYLDLEWSPDGSTAYLTYQLHTLVAVDRSTGATRTVHAYPTDHPDEHSYSDVTGELDGLSPDGRFALLTERWVDRFGPYSTERAAQVVLIELATGVKKYLRPEGWGSASELRSGSWGAAPHDLASAQLEPGGTAQSRSSVTADEPIRTAATSPQGGQVIIHEYREHSGEPVQPGYAFYGRQVVIEAPEGTQTAPLLLTFDIHSSAMPPSTSAANLQVFRNGDPIGPCTGVNGSAVPDPCVSLREALDGGGARLVVLTSKASTWNFGVGCGGSGLVSKPVGKLVGKAPPPVRDPLLAALCAAEGTGL